MSFKKIEVSGTVTLKRFNEDFHFPQSISPQWMEENKEHIRSALVIDLETTGLNSETDEIIEIALKEIKFDRRNGHLLQIGKSYTSLQEPKKEIPKSITNLTGIDFSQVQGQQIDWNKVSEMIQTSDVLIAHYAKFEKSFLDLHLPLSSSKIWACSLTQVDWPSKGFGSSKLEILSIYHGFYVDAHRAMNDVNALIHLLSFQEDSHQKSYLFELLETAKQPRAKVKAFYSPFESKDLLKVRGYMWEGSQKYWYKSILDTQLPEEVVWLEKNVYFAPFKGQIEKLKLCDHFKS